MLTKFPCLRRVGGDLSIWVFCRVEAGLSQCLALQCNMVKREEGSIRRGWGKCERIRDTENTDYRYTEDHWWNKRGNVK